LIAGGHVLGIGFDGHHLETASSRQFGSELALPGAEHDAVPSPDARRVQYPLGDLAVASVGRAGARGIGVRRPLDSGRGARRGFPRPGLHGSETVDDTLVRAHPEPSARCGQAVRRARDRRRPDRLAVGCVHGEHSVPTPEKQRFAGQHHRPGAVAADRPQETLLLGRRDLLEARLDYVEALVGAVRLLLGLARGVQSLFFLGQALGLPA